MTARYKALLWIACASFLPAARAQFVQQGNKLVGTGVVGVSVQGDGSHAVALSADGNTALVGGWYDNTFTGAAWVYTRSAGVWSQQGGKLVGSGSVGRAAEGQSVALSADGNTAMIGGFLDNTSVGAAWVFTRSGGVWTQQGQKLVGAGAVGLAEQGISVTLSADGNTALVGGHSDNSYVGAAWVWNRAGGVWTQGQKLVGAGATGTSGQGVAVALSGDGMTALVGGSGDAAKGAVWVWTQSGGVWSQQGAKLVAPTTAMLAQEGEAVALSADGNTAIVGGSALWVWTRSAGVWTQQGGALIGTGAVPAFGAGAVALSGDGNTAVTGNNQDNAAAGAIWIWKRSGAVWTQQGAKLIGTGSVGEYPCACVVFQGSSVAISADARTILEAGSGDNNNIGAAWVFVYQAALPGTPAPSTILLTLTGLAALILLFRSISL